MTSQESFQGLNAAVAIVKRNSWGSKQNNEVDQKTRFIYNCLTHQDLEEVIEMKLLDSDEANYARRRWINFKRHDAWLEVILEVFGQDAVKNSNDFHQTEDLVITHNDTKYPFDLKITIWSSRARDLDIGGYGLWLYQNQSQQQRFHLRPRLFIVSKDESALYDHLGAKNTIQDLQSNFTNHLHNYVLNGKTVTAIAIEHSLNAT
jgi:hypothetical protein